MEVVVLCCNLLKRVTERHTSEVTLARQLVHLLCRIAFRHQVPGIKARADLLDPGMLRRLTTFVSGSNAEFINDLTSAFTSIIWDEDKQGHIIWATLDIPTTSLSPTSHSALITLFGTVRWSLVERLDRKKLTDFIGKLPIDMIVQRVVDDESVRVGWMRLLLFSTFRSLHRPDAPRLLWRVLLSAFPKLPQSFSRDLRDSLEPSETSLSDLYRNHSDDLPPAKKKEEIEEIEKSLWMKLFWSSRFFELDCKSWFMFEDATVRLGQRTPPLFRQLKDLCFSLENGLDGDSSVARVKTRARMEMSKVQQRLNSIKPPRVLAPQETPASAAAQKQDAADAEKTDPSQPQQVAPKDTRPSNKPDEDPPSQTTQPPKVAPQDTPQSNPAVRRQNTMTMIQVDPPQDPPSPTQRAPPSPPPSSQERTESPTLIDPDHLPHSPTQPGSRDLPALSRPPDHLTTAPKDTPPASLMVHQQNSGLSQIQYTLPPSPATSSGLLKSLSRPPGSPTTTPKDTPPASPTIRQ